MNARIHTLPLLAITVGIVSLVAFDVEATDTEAAVELDVAADLVDAPVNDAPGPIRATLKLPIRDAQEKPAPPPKSVTWNQGDDPALLGPVSDWFCFLTSVSGRFEGGGEFVHVSQSDDFWWLSGSSRQVDVSATATCIPRKWRQQKLEVSDEYTWSQNTPNPKDMGSADKRVCFLTRVTGKFEGGGERVKIYKEQNRWWLGGNSMQRDVAARARCVNSKHQSGPFAWTQGAAATPMASASTWACGLTMMQGRFKGGGERLVVEERDGVWHLGGYSMQRDVNTEAYCM